MINDSDIVFLCFSVFGTFFDITASAFYKIQVWNHHVLLFHCASLA